MEAKLKILTKQYDEVGTVDTIEVDTIGKIFEKNKRDINDSFYSVNRKCRNNLHYSDHHFLSKKDITILDKYQDLYLNNALETFDSYIFLKFGIFYNIGLFLAKLEYWSRTDWK